MEAQRTVVAVFVVALFTVPLEIGIFGQEVCG